LPTVVLAAILITIAFQQWDRWCVTLVHDILRATEPDARSRARRNGLIVLAVMVATIWGQPIVGAAVGVALSCLVFIAEMSRPIVRRELDCSQVASKRIRSQSERATLAQHGCHSIVLELDGVLFFGNADDLAGRVRALEGEADCLILDLHRVTDLDVSGASILQQLAERCRGHGVKLLVCGADPKYAGLVEAALGADAATHSFPDLDSALEDAENRTIRLKIENRTDAAVLRVNQTDLASGLSERELGLLRTALVPCSYAAGAVLCHAGDPADRLWVLTRGSVSVRVAGARAERRIAALGAGTSVGEMGLLDRRPRSADVIADEEVEGFVLTAENFDALLRSEPLLGQSLLATIARQTAQRLRATSEELRLAEA
jgi:SulP family sulfate permease